VAGIAHSRHGKAIEAGYHSMRAAWTDQPRSGPGFLTVTPRAGAAIAIAVAARGRAAMEVDAMEVIVVAAGVLLLIGFICGYTVRGLISRWRRVQAERRDFERLVEKPGRRGG
jgi:hypothetical protein